jgi:hypothetical protein
MGKRALHSEAYKSQSTFSQPDSTQPKPKRNTCFILKGAIIYSRRHDRYEFSF